MCIHKHKRVNSYTYIFMMFIFSFFHVHLLCVGGFGGGTTTHASLFYNNKHTQIVILLIYIHTYYIGPAQAAHLAPTYAATCTICILSSIPSCSTRALTLIDRQAMYEFLLRMKHECGAFHVQVDGEIDTRGVYCTLAVASLLNILTPTLTHNTAKWISCCQTHEGGIGGMRIHMHIYIYIDIHTHMHMRMHTTQHYCSN